MDPFEGFGPCWLQYGTFSFVFFSVDVKSPVGGNLPHPPNHPINSKTITTSELRSFRASGLRSSMGLRGFALSCALNSLYPPELPE